MTTTANAAVQTAAPAAAPAKAPSKMELCRIVYNEIYAEGYDLKGASQRQCFIKRTMAEHGISKHCANTYFQNLSNEKAGKGLYKYNTYQSKKPKAEGAAPKATGGEAGEDLPGASSTPAPAAPAKPAPTKAQVKAAEKGANKAANDLTKRWQVKDGSGNVINSFDTRKEAKDAADADPVATWADRDAKKS